MLFELNTDAGDQGLVRVKKNDRRYVSVDAMNLAAFFAAATKGSGELEHLIRGSVEMKSNNARGGDGDLVINLLDCDRSLLIDLDLFDTPEGVKFLRHHYTLHKVPSVSISESPFETVGTDLLNRPSSRTSLPPGETVYQFLACTVPLFYG